MMPVYATEIWITVLFMFFMFGFVGLLMFSPFMPYMKAKFGKKKLLLTVDRAGEMKFYSADLKNGLYHVSGKPIRFFKQYPGSYRLGGVNTDIVHMDVGFVIKPEFQAAVAELEDIHGIKNYKDLKRAIENRVITIDEIEVPLFFTVPLQSIVHYAAAIPPTTIQAEVDDLFESQKLGDMQGLGKYLPWIIILAILMIAGAVAVRIAM